MHNLQPEAILCQAFRQLGRGGQISAGIVDTDIPGHSPAGQEAAKNLETNQGGLYSDRMDTQATQQSLAVPAQATAYLPSLPVAAVPVVSPTQGQNYGTGVPASLMSQAERILICDYYRLTIGVSQC